MIGTGEVVASLHEMGIERGDHVMVHSSLHNVGPVEGGGDTILDALREVVGPEGNLLFPTFNHHVPTPWFDPKETPSIDGVLTELARKREGAVRRLHPTHSVTVIGPDAERLTRDHLKYRTVGPGSPLDLFQKMGGKVLLLGVTQTSNTMIHLGEEYAGVPKVAYWDPLPVIKIKSPGGMISHRLDSSTSCSIAFDVMEHPLRTRGWITDGRVGRAACRLMRASHVVEAVVALLREQPDALLCSRRDCVPCTGTRRLLAGRGEGGSDMSGGAEGPES